METPTWSTIFWSGQDFVESDIVETGDVAEVKLLQHWSVAGPEGHGAVVEVKAAERQEPGNKILSSRCVLILMQVVVI